jgi:hypothetical protein
MTAPAASTDRQQHNGLADALIMLLGGVTFASVLLPSGSVPLLSGLERWSAIGTPVVAAIGTVAVYFRTEGRLWGWSYLGGILMVGLLLPVGALGWRHFAPQPIAAAPVQADRLQLDCPARSRDVVFPTPFASTPSVVLSPSYPVSGTPPDRIARVDSRGFTIESENCDANYYVNWHAVAVVR